MPLNSGRHTPRLVVRRSNLPPAASRSFDLPLLGPELVVRVAQEHQPQDPASSTPTPSGASSLGVRSQHPRAAPRSGCRSRSSPVPHAASMPTLEHGPRCYSRPRSSSVAEEASSKERGPLPKDAVAGSPEGGWTIGVTSFIRRRLVESARCRATQPQHHAGDDLQARTCAQRRWQRLRGFRHIAKVIRDVRFVDGIEPTEDADHTRNTA